MNTAMDKLMSLTLRHSSLQSELKSTKTELSTVRNHLIKLFKLSNNVNDQSMTAVATYQNIPLTKLIDLYLQSVNQSTTTPQSTPQTAKTLPSIRIRQPKLDNAVPKSLRKANPIAVPPESDPIHVQNQANKLLEETQERFANTQRRCWALERENKSNKETITHWKKKTEETAEHCERLLFHLKQETAAKATAQFRAEDTDRKFKKSKKRIVAIGKERDAIQGRMTLLKQGAEILEGQLRSLDARFVQLRGTLDWQVHHSRGEILACSREFVRLSSQIEDYRGKWNVAEDKAKRLDYDVKALRNRVTNMPQKVEVKVEKTESVSYSSDYDEEEDDDDDEDASEEDLDTDSEDDEEEKARKKKGKAKKKKILMDNKKKKKKKKVKEPTWQYETVSTGGNTPRR